MKKLCFIIPYFGHFPNFFPLFLKTCGTNEEFNWLVFTDDDTAYNYPDNVHKVSMTFEACKVLVQSKFDCKVNLQTPYKLCDLKPMYGYIFEEYIEGFRFWGHCDVDTLMGNLASVLTNDLLNEYDKMFCLGHMVIYRNTQDINGLFMSIHNDRYIYKEVLANPSYCWFDEEWNNDYNINRIFHKQGKHVLQQDLSLNVSMSYNHFRSSKYVGVDKTTMPYGYHVENEKEALYLWNKGDLCRLYKDNGILIREDFLYMHIQKRIMRMDSSILQMNRFKIVPDEFLPLEVEAVTFFNFDQIKKIGYSRHTQLIFINKILKKLQKILHINKYQ
jgi:hypothetical protein